MIKEFFSIVACATWAIIAPQIVLPLCRICFRSLIASAFLHLNNVVIFHNALGYQHFWEDSWLAAPQIALRETPVVFFASPLSRLHGTEWLSTWRRLRQMLSSKPPVQGPNCNERKATSLKQINICYTILFCLIRRSVINVIQVCYCTGVGSRVMFVWSNCSKEQLVFLIWKCLSYLHFRSWVFVYWRPHVLVITGIAKALSGSFCLGFHIIYGI